ncbi:transcriptional repressor CTCF [Lingula anatina]|uniref:CCCTC-binding factor n=1 Tax=Lingula anatina TaxID=7574 RepID=A0A1S3KEB8_LINAN|nr:transcriptional repressor CTCF [Lingula anatina]|eukprot:XP_013420586.2 transcriptional repressor CTCF [Lingula anatina]
MDPAASDSQTAQQGQTNLSDIQNYLASFNKEISDHTGQSFTQSSGNTAGFSVQNFQGTGFNQSQQFPTEVNVSYFQGQQGGFAQGTQFQQAGGDFQGFTSYDFQSAAGAAGNSAGGPMQGQGQGGPQIVQVSGEAGAGGQGVVTVPVSQQPGASGSSPLLGTAQQAQNIVTGQTLGQSQGDNLVSDSVVQALASVAANAIQVPGEMGNTNSSVTPQLVAIQNTANASQPQIIPVSGAPGGDNTSLNAPQAGSLQMLADVTSGQHSQPAAATNVTPVTSSAQQANANSVMLNTGNAYQTVTIVPSENNQGGEISYVLIVSQPGEENKDMSVYDFKEDKGGEIQEEESEDLGDGMRKIKILPKKPGQQSTSVLMCNYCNYTSPKRYLLTRHMRSHSEERPHKCSICERGFKTIASLQNHINTHTGVRPHKCKECDAAFTTSGELVRHVRYRHSFIKPHKCPECDYASVELSKLKRHIRSHTGERPYQCPHCTYASPDTYKLKRHLRIHTGEKPYECDICHARFTQSNSLKAHRLIHSGSKPIYQCELCPTTCGRKTDLKIHVQKLHTSDKPLPCKKCPKSFPDRYSYKLHMKTHDGEKCFKCDFCPYAALSQRFLETHMLTHTGEKPFECDECDQSFRQKQLLRRHKNLYHTPGYQPPPKKDLIHDCPECPKAFAHKGNLMRHMVQHDPNNPDYQQAAADADANPDDDEEEEDISVDTQQIVQAVVEAYHEGVQSGAIHTDDEDDSALPQQQLDFQQTSHQFGRHPNKRGRPRKHSDLQMELQDSDGQGGQQVILLQIDSGHVIQMQPEQVQQLRLADVGLNQHSLEETETEEEEGEPQALDAATPVTSPQKDGDLTVTPTRRSTRRSSSRRGTEGEGEISEEVSPEVDTPTRQTRSTRKRTASGTPEEVGTPAKRQAGPQGTPRRGRGKGDNPGEDEKKREEQKKKDIETCFGFDIEGGNQDNPQQ